MINKVLLFIFLFFSTGIKGQITLPNEVCEWFYQSKLKTYTGGGFRLERLEDSIIRLYKFHKRDPYKSKKDTNMAWRIKDVGDYKLFMLDTVCCYELQGVRKYYDRKGKLQSVSYRWDDQYTYQMFYNNGMIREIINTKNKESHGIHTAYYKNGNLEAIGNYNMGHKDGKWVYYYDNGEIMATGHYEKGWRRIDFIDSTKLAILSDHEIDTVNLNISYVDFVDSLALVLPDLDTVYFKGVNYPSIIGSIIDYRKNRKWKYYDKNGRLIRTEIYHLGKLIEIKENDD